MWTKNIRAREAPIMLLMPPPTPEIVLSKNEDRAYARWIWRGDVASALART